MRPLRVALPTYYRAFVPKKANPPTSSFIGKAMNRGSHRPGKAGKLVKKPRRTRERSGGAGTEKRPIYFGEGKRIDPECQSTFVIFFLALNGHARTELIICSLSFRHVVRSPRAGGERNGQ